MARISRAKEKNNRGECDIELDDGVLVHVELNNELDEWVKDLGQQLLIWRNIPHPDQINQYDVSVKEICSRYNVDPRRSNGRQADNVIGSVLRFVREQAYKLRQSLPQQLLAAKYLKNAFELDPIEKVYKMRPDVAALFDPEEIEDAINDYFDNQPGKHQPQFPTFERSVAVEHIFPLLALLITNFNVEEQIEAFLKENKLENENSIGESEDDTTDDSGFQPE